VACPSCVYPDCLAAPSFPTRRSSDLFHAFLRQCSAVMGKPEAAIERRDHLHHRTRKLVSAGGNAKAIEFGIQPREGIEVVRAQRSEEHTSELQSRFDLVCRRLREKKK